VTSSGRGSRVPWRGGASWAGRSASSSLRAILSIRPRGSVRRRPQKARKRADRPEPGRGAFNVRRMIGRARSQRQTRRRFRPVDWAVPTIGWRDPGPSP
jgi:hypothetical protein